MSLQLKIINPLEYAQWDDLVISTQDYTFFHSSSWARVLCESYSYKPCYFISLDEGKLSVLMAGMDIKSILTGRRWVSIPFSDYCETIINGDEHFQDGVINHIIHYGKEIGWKSIEWRGGDLPQSVAHSSYYYGHTLELCHNEEQLFSTFRRYTKSAIKKAISSGVEVQITNSEESVKEFYRLHCITRKRHGVPPQPYFFFRKIYEHIISKNAGFVVLGSFQRKIIAGAVYFHFGEKAYYKYSASDPDYRHLNANRLAMWEAIKWYNQNNYKSMCLGRTEVENEGLRRYKTGWGTKERIIKYYRYDLTKNTFVADVGPRAASYKRIFQKTPIPFLRLVGLIVYRHMG